MQNRQSANQTSPRLVIVKTRQSDWFPVRCRLGNIGDYLTGLESSAWFKQSDYFSALLKQDNLTFPQLVRCRQDSRLGSVPRLSGSTLQDPLFEPSTPPWKFSLGVDSKEKGWKFKGKMFHLASSRNTVPMFQLWLALHSWIITIFWRVAEQWHVCVFFGKFFLLNCEVAPTKQNFKVHFWPFCNQNWFSVLPNDAFRNPSLKRCTFEPYGSQCNMINDVFRNPIFETWCTSFQDFRTFAVISSLTAFVDNQPKITIF